MFVLDPLDDKSRNAPKLELQAPVQCVNSLTTRDKNS